MKIHLQKFNKGLVPSRDEDKFLFDKLSIDEVYYIEVKKVRNPRFHRKFFALLKLAYDNMPESLSERFFNPEVFRSELLIRAGHCEIYYDFDGAEKFKAKSISFETLDDIEFGKVYSDVLNVILKKVLIETTEEEIENMLFNFL